MFLIRSEVFKVKYVKNIWSTMSNWSDVKKSNSLRGLSGAKSLHQLEALLIVCKQFNGSCQLACLVARKWCPYGHTFHIPSRTSPSYIYFCIHFVYSPSFSDNANVTTLECHQTTQQNLTLTCHWLAETPFKGNIEFELFNEHMTKLAVVHLSSSESSFTSQRLLSENGVYVV